MIRRILTAAAGGIAGITLVYLALAGLNAIWLLFIARLWIVWLLIAVGSGGAALWLGEKLKLIPTDEQLNRKLAPVRLFGQHDAKP